MLIKANNVATVINITLYFTCDILYLFHNITINPTTFYASEIVEYEKYGPKLFRQMKYVNKMNIRLWGQIFELNGNCINIRKIFDNNCIKFNRFLGPVR